MNKYKELEKHVKKIGILGSITEVLSWDQEVNMPENASFARAMEMGTIAEISHNLFTSKKIGTLLKTIDQDKLNSHEKANVNEIEFSYKRTKKLPEGLVKENAETSVSAMEVWRKARKNDDFKSFAPWLKKIIDLNRKKADFIDSKRDPYEVIFDDYEKSISITEVKDFFERLKTDLIPLIKAINKKKQPDSKLLEKKINPDLQKKFSIELAKAIGYDFSKGRLDVSTHPFTACYGRITTRFNEGWLSAILSTIHESGHGMYEHNLPKKYYGLPMGTARSYSVHESQSRFWENHIGRSREFWKFMLPNLRKEYGFKNLDIDKFYSLINISKPGFIRVNADELTYPMHIIIRFEIEQDLINKKLTVENLPSAWNEKMKKYLGIIPKNNKEGCLQDMHWASGGLGYFATYALGSMISAQLYKAIAKNDPKLKDKISKGDFSDIHDFLEKNIHSKGQLYTTKELIKKATGKDISPDDYVEYLKEKFSGLYSL
ncbi:MAG: carboxypeptidase M32 [Candidatus Woesearchaeota archaeon]